MARMKFRMFTMADNGTKVAVNVDRVSRIVEGVAADGTWIEVSFDDSIRVEEDFDTVFSRLNTVAEFDEGGAE